MRLSEEVCAFGNATEVKGPRRFDFGIDDDNDPVGPFAPTAASDEVSGASTFADPRGHGLTGYYYKLPAGTELPPELGIHADGIDVGGSSPAGHHTIYPAVVITFARFRELVMSLPWERAGKVSPE